MGLGGVQKANLINQGRLIDRSLPRSGLGAITSILPRFIANSESAASARHAPQRWLLRRAPGTRRSA